MQYVNLTPHAVAVMDKDGATILNVPAGGTVARLSETSAASESSSGIPMTVVSLGEVSGLPEPQDGVTFIGSMPLLMGMKAAGINRPDVFYPYGQVRDSSGRIIGCRSFATIA
jgi:hypothetical protein